MTDSRQGMEGSEHRIRKLTRTLVAGFVIALVVAGCGGGDDGGTSVPAPVNQAPSAGGAVTAEGTIGLVGPSSRSTGKSQQFNDKTGKIPGDANRKPKAQVGVGAEDECQNIGITPSADNLDTVNAAILCLVNAERKFNGNLPPLAQNSQLDKAAAGMAARMVSEHFFAHETPDGKTVVDRVEPTGYIPNSGDWVVGENLAWGSGALSTPQAIVNGWMNSPGHRANILAPDYKDIGLASALGSPSTQQTGGTVYVNNFGAKSGADITATLPGHEDESGGGDTAAAAGVTVAGAKTAKAKAKAKAKRKAKKRKRRRRH